MKKYLLNLFLFGSIISFAQNHFVGVQSGVNYSYLIYESYNDPTPLSSFSTAFVYEYRFKNSMLFGSGIQYERRAYESIVMYFPEDSDYMLADLKSTNDFIALPLKAGYSIGKKWNGYAFLGLQASYLLKANKNYSYYNSEDKYDVTDDFNRFELGGILELGTGYMLTDRLNIFLNASYLYAFTDISKNTYIEQKHQRFNMSFGFKYALKAGEL